MIGLGGESVLQQAELARFVQPAAEQQQPSVFDQALSQYPILQGLGLQYKRSQADPAGSLLEFWPPGEPGTSDRPRPKEFDLKTPGVEVFSDKVRPIDVLGDVVSHHMIENDEKISRVYESFKKSITPEQDALLAQQYQHAKANEGETRSFDQWKERSGIPAFFRGHPFQQWPDEFNQQVYTPQQLKLLDAMMMHLQKK